MDFSLFSVTWQKQQLLPTCHPTTHGEQMAVDGHRRRLWSIEQQRRGIKFVVPSKSSPRRIATWSSLLDDEDDGST